MLASLASVSVESGTAQAWQRNFAWVVFAAVALIFVAGLSVLRYRAREQSEREHLQNLRPQLLETEPSVAYLRYDDSDAERRETLRALVESSERVRPTSIREAARAAWAEVERDSPLQPGATRALGEAAALLIAAAIAGLAIASVDGLTPNSESISTGAEWLLTTVLLLWVAFQAVIAVVPGGELLLSVRDPEPGAVVATVLALVLVAEVLAIRRLSDRQQGTDWRALLRHGPGLAREAVDVDRRLGIRIGLTVGRVLVLHGVFRATKTLAALILVIFGGSLIIDGHLFAAIETLVGAGPLGWVVLAALPFAVAVFVRMAVPNAGNDLVRAVQRLLRSAGVRGRLIVTGLPILTTTLAGLIIGAFAASVPVAVIGALTVGTATRVLTRIYSRVKFRVASSVDRKQRVDEIRIEATTLKDANDTPLYILTVGGHDLAHRTVEDIVTAGLKAASWRLDGPDIESDRQPPRNRPLIEHHYYQQAVQFGRVDLVAVREQYRGDIVATVNSELATGSGAVDRDDLREQLRRQYDPAVVDRQMTFLRQSGQLIERDEVVTSR